MNKLFHCIYVLYNKNSNLPDHMASFSKASSWVSESSARIREVCVYGKGEPRHVLYFSTSQVVDFLQKSLNTVSFGCKMTARATIEVAAHIQSIQKPPTMEQRRLEDILEAQQCSDVSSNVSK